MNVSYTKPQADLSPYVASIWELESSSGIPSADSRVIVPNGKARIIVPCEESLPVTVNGQVMNTKEQLFLTGLWDSPTTISSDAEEMVTIGVELTPKGLYRFFNLSMREITNRIFGFEELFGVWGAKLQARLGSVENRREKIALLENTLLELLHRSARDYPLLDRAVDLIARTHGTIRIQELATQTGYSKRYLDMLFKENVGLSPKWLASIMRFQKFYRLWAREKSPSFYDDNLYAYYCDQSHFIKEFRRFTGYSPTQYNEIPTAFSSTFYQGDSPHC